MNSPPRLYRVTYRPPKSKKPQQVVVGFRSLELLRMWGSDRTPASGCCAKGSKATRGLRFRHGSDVEIGQKILERLEDLYGPLVTADSTAWHWTGSQFAPLRGEVLTLHIHSADGAACFTPEGKPSVVKLGKSGVASVADSMLSYRAQPEFFVSNSASTPPVIPANNGILVFDPESGEFHLEEHSRRHRNRHVPPGRYLPKWVDLWREVDAANLKAAQAFREILLGCLLYGCFLSDPDADQKADLLGEIAGVVAAGWATRMSSPRAIIAIGERAGNPGLGPDFDRVVPAAACRPAAARRQVYADCSHRRAAGLEERSRWKRTLDPRPPSQLPCLGGTDLLAILAKDQTEPENAISRFPHFQRLVAVENAGTSLCRGNRE